MGQMIGQLHHSVQWIVLKVKCRTNYNRKGMESSEEGRRNYIILPNNTGEYYWI